ncbi:MAG TPA: hypothetical protein VF493_02865 [Terriglobales bacterium]
MYRSIRLVVALAVALLPAFYIAAQRGGGGHSAGAGAGAGMGHSGAGMSHSTGMSNHDTGSAHQAPTTRLENNSHLNTSLTNALTKSGVTLPSGGLQAACSGFKNLGQCVSALHVSNNLKISFDCLKADMTGQAPAGTGCPTGTGTSKMSMGKSISALQPTADAKAETRKANKQADEDLKDAESNS